MSLLGFTLNAAARFARVTGVAGFGQIVRSAHWVESVLWALGIVASICLAVRDCITPIEGYLNEDSLSKVKFVKSSHLSFPNSSICIEFDTSELQIENQSILEDVDATKRFIACLREPACVEQGFIGNFTDQVHASSKLLALFIAFEDGRPDRVEAVNQSASSIPDSFRQLLLAEGITSKYLATALGYAFCIKMQFEAILWHKNKRSISSFCNNTTLVWFGCPPRSVDEVETLCYKIDAFSTFGSMEDKFELSFYPNNIRPKAQQSLNSFAYLNLDGVPITTDITTDYVWVPFDHCTSVEIDLLQRVTVLSKRAHLCNAQQPFLECLGRCGIRSIATRCQCRSIGWELYISDEPDERVVNESCFSRYASADYNDCTRVNGSRKTAERRVCEDACVDRCERSILHIFSSPCSLERPLRPNATVVFYRLHRFFYPHVEEQLVYDVSTLTSAIGGILGLWLGVGFIGILEALVFFPKCVTQYVVSAVRTNHEEGELSLKDVNRGLAELKREIEARDARYMLLFTDCFNNAGSSVRSDMVDAPSVDIFRSKLSPDGSDLFLNGHT